MSYYKLDVDGIQVLVDAICPNGQVLTDEYSTLNKLQAPLTTSAGSFSQAAQAIEAFVGSFPAATRRMSVFGDGAVDGLRTMVSAYLLGDAEMESATARAATTQAWKVVR